MDDILNFRRRHVSAREEASSHVTRERNEHAVERLNLNPNLVTYDNSTGKISYDGNLQLSSLRLTKVPIEISSITGSFNISYNRIGSFDGFPERIGGDLIVMNNYIPSFIGVPRSIGGEFYGGRQKVKPLFGIRLTHDNYIKYLNNELEEYNKLYENAKTFEYHKLERLSECFIEYGNGNRIYGSIVDINEKDDTAQIQCIKTGNLYEAPMDRISMIRLKL